MPHVITRVRWIFGAILLTLVVSCGSGDEVAWGTEAVEFFNELALEHAENDFYGVLDFYTRTAFIEMWRGDLRGGARIPDLLRWNSGDLDQEILEVYLGGSGAMTLVHWPGNGGRGAVVSSIEHGLIDGETVYDQAGSLERSLRATPDIVARYEGLFAEYARVWSSGDGSAIAELYAPHARVEDSLIGLALDSRDQVVSVGRPGASVAIGEVPGDDAEPSATGSPIFLGPVEYGGDPGRAAGIYEVSDDAGCTSRIAVVWRWEDGLIVDEQRYHELSSFPDCARSLPAGWWTGLTRPQPSDEVVTGIVTTSDGHEFEVRNGVPVLESSLESALASFMGVGLAEPTFDTVTFEPSRKCVNRSGRVLQSGGKRDLYICLFESDVCPTIGSCLQASDSIRGAFLHELAHAWLLDHVSGEIERQVLELSGRTDWNDEQQPWARRGVEYAAEVITWGLLEEPPPMVRIGNPTCEELANAFHLLTGVDAPHEPSCAAG